MPTLRIKRLDELLPNYDVILCDVWGVLHNGVDAWTQAYKALMRARDSGVKVVLITNAPRPSPKVIEQLGLLGVPSEAYDAVVTSGDVTRTLIADSSSKVFHLGPQRDMAIYEGLEVDLVDQQDADVVVCTGLFDDDSETPDDYTDRLQQMKDRDLPFICANPDIVVEKGERLIFCAGALARAYAELGGETYIAGKPYKPIYEEAIRIAEKLLNAQVDRSRVLAIGDGMPTDVKGAMDNNLDLLFISDGIHSREYGRPGAPDENKLNAYLDEHNAVPVATMTKLA
ncbi:TIGR01459 family HAD-type hydrolase [Ahrensia marina]|uniref:HAD family hydrolase n=1 Tax=Ahrensia marina TaxID=1514904 RepID=A0A0M9GPE1_9HYPH|nr:TIGR01459 family HAD-type hydrolase [Ahrensia marina]KPB02560.1 HAD family hydrolase [Ahrensia marina]